MNLGHVVEETLRKNWWRVPTMPEEPYILIVVYQSQRRKLTSPESKQEKSSKKQPSSCRWSSVAPLVWCRAGVAWPAWCEDVASTADAEKCGDNSQWRVLFPIFPMRSSNFFKAAHAKIGNILKKITVFFAAFSTRLAVAAFFFAFFFLEAPSATPPVWALWFTCHSPRT